MTQAEPVSHVLALNSGSSSLKFGLYRVGRLTAEMMLSGEATSIGEEKGEFRARDRHNTTLFDEAIAIPDQRGAIVRIAKLLADSNMPTLAGVGHRIVHGGPILRQHCKIDDLVMRQLEAASEFAPLHTPAAISVIHFAADHFPGLLQVACFDTSFHAELPEVARVLPIPKELQSEGIQRYGFHGLSCESVVRQLSDDLPDRLIIAHLGNGASLTAVKGGKSIDTTMGLTPTGGVIMGTRSGDLDPGILIYLMRGKGLDSVALEQLVNHRAGLLGISGFASDMRRLHEVASSNVDARLAVQMFCYSVRKQVAAMIAVLEGIDMLVFTGGIGENDVIVRRTVCAGLSWAGVASAELQGAPEINSVNHVAFRCPVRVLASQENQQIALHTAALVRQSAF